MRKRSLHIAYWLFKDGGRHVCLWILLFVSTAMVAQENPFDLKYRKQSAPAKEAKTEVVPESSESGVIAEDVKPSVDDSLLDFRSLESETEEKTTSFEIDLESDSAETAVDSADVQDVTSTGRGEGLSGINKVSLFLLLLAITLLVTLTISGNKKIVNKIIKAVLNDNYLNLLYREQKKNPTGNYYLLYLLFAVNLGLYFYFFLMTRDQLGFTPALWRCIALVAVTYLVRHIVLAFLDNIYEFSKEVEQFAFTILIFNVFLGLLLLPVNVFIAFSPVPVSTIFIYFGLVLVLISYLFRQLRGLFLAGGLILNSKFYFFLYLCAVEIAPLLLIIKYLGAILS